MKDKKRGSISIVLPLTVAAVFTLIDVLVMKTTKSFLNPEFVLFSFLELYLVSIITVLLIRMQTYKNR